MSSKRGKMPIYETPILLEEVVTSIEAENGFYKTENGVLFDGIVTIGIISEIYRSEKRPTPSLLLMDEYDTVKIYASPSKYSADAIRKIDRVFPHDIAIIHGRFNTYMNKKGETVPQINISAIESISLKDPITVNKYRQGFYLEVLKQRAKGGIKLKNAWGISKTAKDFKIPQVIDGEYFTIEPPKEMKPEIILSPKKENEKKSSEKNAVKTPAAGKTVIPKKTAAESPVKKPTPKKTEKNEVKKVDKEDLAIKIIEMLKNPEIEKGKNIGRSFDDIAKACNIPQKDVARAIMPHKDKISVFSYLGATRVRLKE